MAWCVYDATVLAVAVTVWSETPRREHNNGGGLILCVICFLFVTTDLCAVILSQYTETLYVFI